MNQSDEQKLKKELNSRVKNIMDYWDSVKNDLTNLAYKIQNDNIIDEKTLDWDAHIEKSPKRTTGIMKCKFVSEKEGIIEPIFGKSEDHPKKWGKETWLCNNDEFCGKLLYFDKNAKFSFHFHVKKREVFFILTGKILFRYFDLTNADEKEIILSIGDTVEIPRCCPHQIVALEESIVIEVSSHHEENDSLRVRKGDSQKV